MTSPSRIVIAFDLYGTLLCTESIAHELAKIYGEDMAASLAAAWRRHQLEYTWRMNSMGQYKPFDQITRNALSHALAEHDQTLTSDNTTTLMHSYDSLHVFPEIPKAMQIVKKPDEPVVVVPYIFSNGTESMIANSVQASPELAPYADIFHSFITVDDVKCYKPDPRTYAHLIERSKAQDCESHVWVVSANAFDIVGARTAGLKAAFIDRAGKGWVDRLLDEQSEDNIPSLISSSVKEAIECIFSYVSTM
ncbi:haloacid dehalogenase [Xylaria sp. CBS 124048]|nr:haloacid dehalogenase [Xylaria sp. CBS 124048]